MKRISNFIGKIFLFCSTILLSWLCVRWVAERYFFDKFFYYKSIEFGYWGVKKDQKLEDFGERTKDLAALLHSKKQITNRENVLGNEIVKKKEYTIFVIGDSYVFGQGIRQEDRFSIRLARELNKIRKTKVYNFGSSGNSFLENYLFYKEAVATIGNPSLVIFGLVTNDFLILPTCIVRCEERKTILDSCTGKLIYEPRIDGSSEASQERVYGEAQKESLDVNSRNFCIFSKVTPLFPRENTIYFDFDAIRHPKWDLKSNFIQAYKNNDILVFDAMPYLRKPYPRLYSQVLHVGAVKPLDVSNKDTHPSRLAHKIYAEALTDEIVSNSKLGFQK